MVTENLFILKMLEGGSINVHQAIELLEAIQETVGAEQWLSSGEAAVMIEVCLN